MKIARIESDGRTSGTRVFLENGEELELVTDITWELAVEGGLPKIRFVVLAPHAVLAVEPWSDKAPDWVKDV